LHDGQLTAAILAGQVLLENRCEVQALQEVVEDGQGAHRAGAQCALRQLGHRSQTRGSAARCWLFATLGHTRLLHCQLTALRGGTETLSVWPRGNLLCQRLAGVGEKQGTKKGKVTYGDGQERFQRGEPR